MRDKRGRQTNIQKVRETYKHTESERGIEREIQREIERELFFSCPTTKALTPSPFELSSHIFFELQKKFFFLSGPTTL